MVESGTSASDAGLRPPEVVDVRFDDVDAFAAAATGWNQTYDQLSPGPLRARLRAATLPGLILGREQTDCSILLRSALADEHDFMIAEAGVCDDRTRWLDHECPSHVVATLSCPDEVRFRSPARMDIVYALIDQGELARVSERCTGRDVLRQLQGTHTQTTDPVANAALGRFMRRAVSRMVDDPASFVTLTAQRDVSHEIIALFLRVTDTVGGRPRRPRPSLRRRRQIVRAVESFALEHPWTPLSAVDICLIAHASERSVDYAFQYCYGMSPKAYLKRLRLNAVRRALRAGDPDTTTVRDAAERFGFRHMGHFGRDYKQLFGELPSATLRAG